MIRTLAVLLLISAPGFSIAQSTLVPTWSHTWAFGQDPQSLPLGFPGAVSQDNHVTYDSSTGLVHLTIDDQLQQESPHFDFLYTFDAVGTDLTTSPVPLLGSAVPSPGGAQANVESTRDLVARNGRIIHQRELFIGAFQTSTTGSICAQGASGSLWRLGLGNELVARGIVLLDDDGVIAVRPVGDNFMTFVDAEGWPERLMSNNGQGAIRDAVLAGNEILCLTDGQLLRFDRSSGASMGSPAQLFSNGTGHLIASDGVHVHYVYSPWAGGIMCASADLEGNLLWETYLPDLINYTELELDNYGRPWITGNHQTGSDTPVLVVIGSDGSALWTFTYGATMNDLAMGDGQAYITGQLTNGENSTYLIAVSAEITVGETMAEAPATGLMLYPTPASSTLSVGGGARIRACRVFDATGQQVEAPLVGNSTLDVSGLVTGVYFLEALTASGIITRRFAVAR